MRITASSVSNNAKILQQREGEAKAALAAQKSRVLTLNRKRDDMAVLNKEVENAQLAYQAAAQRYSQVQLQGQSTQSEVAVLNPATVPTDPAGPKVLFYTLAAAMFGLMLGLGLALLAELLDRRVRNRDDLAALLQVPVLGEINWLGRSGRQTGFLPASFTRRLSAS
jgi:uncharacterized protein involved in exopolysaccharide biosynthesis